MFRWSQVMHPEIDALFAAAAGRHGFPRDPRLGALLGRLGLAADRVAADAHDALARCAVDPLRSESERVHAASRLAELDPG